MSTEKEYCSMRKDIKIANKEISAKLESLQEQNNTTRWVLGSLITTFGIIMPVLFYMHAKSIDSQIKSVKAKIDSKYELISQQLNTMEE